MLLDADRYDPRSTRIRIEWSRITDQCEGRIGFPTITLLRCNNDWQRARPTADSDGSGKGRPALL